MEELNVKNDLIKITKDLILGTILNEMIEVCQNFRKQIIESKKHCPEFFEVDLEKISEDNFLNLSNSTMRRNLKKLEEMKLITINKMEKKHTYRVNIEIINIKLKEIGANIIEKVKGLFINKKDKEEIKEEVKNTKAKKEEDVEEIKEKIKKQIEYELAEEIFSNGSKFEDAEFFKMFNSIYKIILETKLSKEKYIIINKKKIATEVVNEVFSSIKFNDIEEIIWSIKKVNHKIFKMKKYILTTMYNHQIENEFVAQNAFNIKSNKSNFIEKYYENIEKYYENIEKYYEKISSKRFFFKMKRYGI